MNENHIYQEAKKRVKRKTNFYRHLAFYVVFNTVFFFVTYSDKGNFDWIYAASIWGIGLAINYFSVFGLPGSERVGGADWEAKEIRKEVEKMGGTTHDIPREELELREIQKQKRGWDESDLV